jgi:hypothetical protein
MHSCCSFKAQRIYPMTGAVLENHWLNIAEVIETKRQAETL